jgi:hypothetical protein
MLVAKLNDTTAHHFLCHMIGNAKNEARLQLLQVSRDISCIFFHFRKDKDRFDLP